MQHIGNRGRTTAYGEQALSPRIQQGQRQQVLFRQAGATVASTSQQAGIRAQAAVERGLQANASALRHIGARIQTGLLQGLVGIALANVHKQAPPLPAAVRLSVAIRHIEQKFSTIKPTYAQVQQTIAHRATDPATFDKVIDVLRGTKACNVFSFFGALENFRQAPALDKALAIVDTYISDPKDDDIGGTAFDAGASAQESKPMDVNLYRADYLKFMDKLTAVKVAIAFKEPDANQQLAGLFDQVAQTLQQDLKQVGSSMEAVIKDHRAMQRGLHGLPGGTAATFKP